MKKESESSIVRAICEYLAFKKYVFWRNNNVGIWDQKGFYRKISFGFRKGIPDISVFDTNGDYIGLEVKTRDGKPSPDQKRMAEDFKRLGVEYYVVRSVEDCKEIGL